MRLTMDKCKQEQKCHLSKYIIFIFYKFYILRIPIHTLRIRRDFPLWLRNQLISTGLELVLNHTEKSCIVLYPVFYELKIYIIILTTFVSPWLRHLGVNKTGFNLIIVHF